MTRTFAPQQTQKRSSGYTVSHPHDPAECQAHQAADVVARGGSVAGWRFGSVQPSAPIHREETGKPAGAKDDKKEYKEAATKVVEAVLETDSGKKAKELVLATPLVKTTTDFFTTPIGLGTGGLLLAGSLGGLAAAKQPLPFQLPAVPLEKIHPALSGITGQVIIEGPVNAPTYVGLTLTFGGGSSDKGKKGKEGQKPVQREPADTVGTAALDTSGVEDVERSSGSPLEPSVRRKMESRFGYDFGAVRVHDDAHAHNAAHGVDAKAFTVGSHIGFAPGLYNPGSPDGDRLLAHELAHVVQQEGGKPGGRHGGDAHVHRQVAGGTAAPLADRVERFNVGRGGHLMDAVFDPSIGWLTARMKVKFNFVNAPQAWPSAAAQTQWQNDFIERVTNRWSFKHFLRPINPAPGDTQRIVVRVQVVPVTSGQHYTANVGYTTAFRTSSVSRQGHSATFDSLDTSARTDISQTPVEHEFGHMLGLPHIAGDDNSPASYGVTAQERADVMGVSSYVSPRDYEVFAELMYYFSGRNWRVEQASFIPTTGGRR